MQSDSTRVCGIHEEGQDIGMCVCVWGGSLHTIVSLMTLSRVFSSTSVKIWSLSGRSLALL